MDNTYYLNEEGLSRLLLKLASKIRDNTTGSIVQYTNPEAISYNELLPGAIPAEKVLTAAEATAVNDALGTLYITGQTISVDDSAEYNSLLEGAVSEGDPINPNNFITAEAVVEYLRNRENLVINYEESVAGINDEYSVIPNTIEYNGEKGSTLNLSLITASEIDRLFYSVQ